MEIKEVKINEINVPGIHIYNPFVPRIKKVPKLIVDYPACIKVHRNNLFTEIDIDKNGTVIECGIKMPSYEPLEFTPMYFSGTQSTLTNRAEQKPEIKAEQPKIAKKNNEEEFYIPCPPLNPQFMKGDYRNDKRLFRFDSYTRIEINGVFECVENWEKVPFRETFIGTPQSLISTSLIGVVAGGSALLAPLIKKLISTIFKKLKKKITKEEKKV
tara:strand:- start:1907 stop:2548 length:642 start_codon:yes stop_codon:yes gene_type:complete